jgi:hypothetical protein
MGKYCFIINSWLRSTGLQGRTRRRVGMVRAVDCRGTVHTCTGCVVVAGLMGWKPGREAKVQGLEFI